MRLYLILLMLVLLPSVSAGFIQMELQPNGVILANVEGFEIYETLNTPLDIKGVHTIKQSEGITRIIFEDDISYRVVGLVSLQDQQQIFSNDFKITEPSEITLILPEGFVLADISVPVVPKPKIGTDGRRIYLIWEQSEDFSAVVVYERSFEQIMNNVSIIINLAVIIIAIIAILIVLNVANGRLRQTLGENELSIIRILGRNRGIIRQKELAENSGYSKSRISKLIARLETKGFVEKVEENGIKKIKLKRKV